MGIDLYSKLILDAELFGRNGTVPAVAFLHRLAEKHDFLETVLLVDGLGDQTSLAQLGLGGRRDYTDRNLVKKWFQTVEQRSTAFITHGWAVGGAFDN